MERFSAVVEKSGRILIPVAVRRKLGIQEGQSELIVRVDDEGISVTTRQQTLRRVRARLREYIPEGSDVAGELMADRRREADRENRK
jgi:AbrB family looped-hinge helix DNA binding protein